LGTRDSYAHALSPVERVLGHFLWDPGLLNVALRRQKMDLPVTLISGQKDWLYDQLYQSKINDEKIAKEYLYFYVVQ